MEQAGPSGGSNAKDGNQQNSPSKSKRNRKKKKPKDTQNTVASQIVASVNKATGPQEQKRRAPSGSKNGGTKSQRQRTPKKTSSGNGKFFSATGVSQQNLRILRRGAEEDLLPVDGPSFSSAVVEKSPQLLPVNAPPDDPFPSTRVVPVSGIGRGEPILGDDRHNFSLGRGRGRPIVGRKPELSKPGIGRGQLNPASGHDAKKTCALPIGADEVRRGAVGGPNPYAEIYAALNRPDDDAGQSSARGTSVSNSCEAFCKSTGQPGTESMIGQKHSASAAERNNNRRNNKKLDPVWHKKKIQALEDLAAKLDVPMKEMDTVAQQMPAESEERVIGPVTIQQADKRQGGKTFYNHREDFRTKENNKARLPKLEDFKDHPVSDGSSEYQSFMITIATHRPNSEYGFKCVSVKRQNEKVGIGHRSEILYPLNCSENELREGMLENVLRIMGKSKISRPKSDKDIRDPLCQISLPVLQKEFIWRMKKKPVRFPTAVYFCHVCDYHIPSIWRAREHIMDKFHTKARDDRLFGEVLKTIPPPTQAHCDKVTELLESILCEYGRSVEELREIAEIGEKLTAEVMENIDEGTAVRVYGSCLSGVALKDSNVNLELTYGENLTHAFALIETEKMLKAKQETGEYSKVEADYTARWPHVRFRSALFPKVDCVLSVRNWQAWEIGMLIRHYVEVWQPFAKLAQAVRHWTKVCGTSDWDSGCLHVYSFDLMLIHYLQQLSPPVLPVLTPKTRPYELDVYHEMIKAEKSAFTTRNDLSLGALFIDFLKFLATSDLHETVIQIRTLKPVKRDEKGWNSKRIGIEDPYLPNKNLANLSQGAYEYLHHCIQRSYMYYGIPQTKDGPLFYQKDGRLELRNFSKTQETPDSRDSEPIPEEQDLIRVETDGNIKITYTREEFINLQECADVVSEGLWRHLEETGVARQSQCHTKMPENWRTKDKALVKEINAFVGCVTVVTPGEETIAERKCEDLVDFGRLKLEQVTEEFCPTIIEGSLEAFFGRPNLETVTEGASSPTEINVSAETERMSKISLSDLGIFATPPTENVAETEMEESNPLKIETKESIEVLSEISKESDEDRREACLSVLENLMLKIEANKAKFNLEIVREAFPTSFCDRAKVIERDRLGIEAENLPKNEPESVFVEGSESKNQLECLADEGQNLLENELEGFGNGGNRSEKHQNDEKNQIEPFTIEKKNITSVSEVIDIIDQKILENQKNNESNQSETVLVKEGSSNQSEPIEDAGETINQSEAGGHVSENQVEEVENETEDQSEEAETAVGNGDEEKAEEEIRMDLSEAANKLQASEFVFEMKGENLTMGKKPEIICSYCNQLGHFFRTCPDRNIPPIRPLPPMTQDFINLMRQLMDKIMSRYEIKERRYNDQETVRLGLEQLLQSEWNDARLDLFGSSKNGLGFERSDIDLCLRFTSESIPQCIDPVSVIRRVAKVLSRCQEIKEIIPVTAAKVPIVKFFHTGIRLEGDISLYNVLALRNTELMSTYCLVDPRVRQLGYMVKAFAKHCDIGDASKGSLSSYAYIIMMIHYLQNCEPPVLPVLQQTFDTQQQIDRTKFMVDGWDTYFFKDVQNLSQIWSGYNLNQQQVPELWLGFLCYYSETHNYDRDVIQIRQKAELTKFEKLWTDKALCVEDPFDLNHNLAAGLSKKMFGYIRRTIINAREVFGDCMNSMKKLSGREDNVQLQKYFLDLCYIEEGPPQDRQCRMCRRVGHFVEQCPLKKRNRIQTIEGAEGEENYEIEYKPRHFGAPRQNLRGGANGTSRAPGRGYGPQSRPMNHQLPSGFNPNYQMRPKHQEVPNNFRHQQQQQFTIAQNQNNQLPYGYIPPGFPGSLPMVSGPLGNFMMVPQNSQGAMAGIVSNQLHGVQGLPNVQHGSLDDSGQPH